VSYKIEVVHWGRKNTGNEAKSMIICLDLQMQS